MECAELTTTAILAASNTLEVTEDEGDNTQPVLSPAANTPDIWE